MRLDLERDSAQATRRPLIETPAMYICGCSRASTFVVPVFASRSQAVLPLLIVVIRMRDVHASQRLSVRGADLDRRAALRQAAQERER